MPSRSKSRRRRSSRSRSKSGRRRSRSRDRGRRRSLSRDRADDVLGLPRSKPAEGQNARASLISLGVGNRGGGPAAPPSQVQQPTLHQMLSPLGQLAGSAMGAGGEPKNDVVMKPGDWFCPGCGDFQFKRYPYCRRCRAPQPAMPTGVTSMSAGGTLRAAPLSNSDAKKTKWDTNSVYGGPAGQLGAMLSSIDASSVARGANPIPPLPPGCTIIGGVCVRDAMPEKTIREVPIAAKDKGGFIGKGGEAINRIRGESGANVKLHYDEAKDSAVVEIKGTDEQVDKAEKLVQQRIEDIKNGIGPGGKWESKTIEIPRVLIADTIGPGGCHLQAMAEATDCKVRFVQASEFDQTAPASKQVALIRGLPENIPKAEALLMERAREVAEIQHEKDLAALEANPNPAKIPCKFHMRRIGNCKNGSQCPFSHDAGVIAASQAYGTFDETVPYKSLYCKFFDSGRCGNGASCHYAHGLDELHGEMTARNIQIMREAQQMAALDQALAGEGASGAVGILPVAPPGVLKIVPPPKAPEKGGWGADSVRDEWSWDDPSWGASSWNEPSWEKGKGKGGAKGQAKGGPMDPTWLGGSPPPPPVVNAQAAFTQYVNVPAAFAPKPPALSLPAAFRK